MVPVAESLVQVSEEEQQLIEEFRAERMSRPGRDWAKIWRERMDSLFYSRPGSHMLITGNNGSGKTQLLLYFLRKFLEKPSALFLAYIYTVVWIDIGKSSEIANLGLLRPLRIFVPEGCDIKIKVSKEFRDRWHYSEDGAPAEIVYFRTTRIKEMWRKMSSDKINVISLMPFILEDMSLYAEMIGKVFARLVYLAQREKLSVPMVVFCDEFQLLCPEKQNALSDNHYSNGAVIQRNIESLRSCFVGFIAAAQEITDIRHGVRKQLQWRAIKRGSRFIDAYDEALKKKNYLWTGLQADQFYIADPNRAFSDKAIHFDCMNEGRDVAHVTYIGTLHGKQEEEPDEETPSSGVPAPGVLT